VVLPYPTKDRSIVAVPAPLIVGASVHLAGHVEHMIGKTIRLISRTGTRVGTDRANA
jgi:hypothetical protein